MDFGEIFVIGVALFVLFIFFAAWLTEGYDKSESLLCNLGILAAGIFFVWKIFPGICACIGAFVSVIF